MSINETAEKARRAAIRMAAATTEQKNQTLEAVRAALLGCADAIIAANAEDMAQAKKENLDDPLLKRLKFDTSKIDGVCEGIESLIRLNDPVGQTLDATELDAGLELYKVTCPIGVIGVIFESRPDALVQISTLCLKSGNAVLLKGGSEAMRTNRILAETISKAAIAAGMPDGWLGLMETRDDVAEMLNLEDDIDLIIPRGSNAFVKHIMNNSNIPVLGHADGICHVYIDADADVNMAIRIAVDSKCQYVAVCNAEETLLVHQAIAADILPELKKTMEAKGVELLGCEKTQSIIDIKAATEADWKTEYLDYTLSIRVVDGLDSAIEHINTYGSGHTDAIVTGSKETAMRFMDLVDSGDVFWNCSTRFSDGFRYGLGAEVGISTNKIHARGPVGLEGLLIYKWRMIGSGQIVADYGGPDGKKFTHKKLNKNWNS